MKYILLVCAWRTEVDYSLYILEDSMFNKIRMC